MLARSPGAWGPAWSEDGNPASHGTVRKPTWFAGSWAVRVAGSRPQGPVGQVSRGLGARAGPPGAWGLFPTKTTQTLKLRFFRKPPVGSLAKAWVSAETAASEVGTWRETKPGYPPYPPPPTPPHFGAVREKGRVFTLSAFGNHPTRPPRSADTSLADKAEMPKS